MMKLKVLKVSFDRLDLAILKRAADIVELLIRNSG
jgi:hypothetical protein